MKFTVQEEMILFDFLVSMTHKKRNDIKNLLKYKNIYVDGRIETYHAFVLRPGQVVEIKKGKEQSPFEILYEDKDLLVIDKPCGLLTEQTSKEAYKTAFYMVKEYLAKKKEKVFLVHRLDQYTSGVLLFVKTKALYETLTHDWNRYVKVRGYIAVVEGKMKKPKGTIENYLAESKTQHVYITSKEQGKKAITHYKVIKTSPRYSMLEVRLDTGRKNQIRVHMSSLHHPIVGDEKYGATTNPIKRLGLHAHELMIIHPFTHQEMRFIAHTPESFDKLFKKR